jgi:uncharacterized protein
MDRTVMWMQWNNLGMEQLHIANNIANNAQPQTGGVTGFTADGVVVGIKDGRPFRTRYRVDIMPDWQVRALRIEHLDTVGRNLWLRSDGEGQWWGKDDAPAPELNGCVDLDLSVTPFTNTLAIRRLALQPGEVRHLSVVYIAVPELEIRAVPQRYTCLESSSQGGIYRYEGLVNDFSVELMVDRDGLVIEYPQAFRRVWSVEEPR